MQILTTSTSIQNTTDIYTHSEGDYTLSFYAYDPTNTVNEADIKLVVQGVAQTATTIEEEVAGWKR